MLLFFSLEDESSESLDPFVYFLGGNNNIALSSVMFNTFVVLDRNGFNYLEYQLSSSALADTSSIYEVYSDPSNWAKSGHPSRLILIRTLRI